MDLNFGPDSLQSSLVYQVYNISRVFKHFKTYVKLLTSILEINIESTQLVHHHILSNTFLMSRILSGVGVCVCV